MDGFSKHKNVKELIGCFNTEQRKGFDIVLSLLYETFSNIDCWPWDDNSSRISFGSKSKEVDKYDGHPIFGLVKKDNSIIFRVSSASKVLYREMALTHGPGWEKKALRHNTAYHFNLDNISKDSSSLRKFLEKMSQVNVVCERANGNQYTPDDYPIISTPPGDYSTRPVTTSVDGDGGCADKKVWAQINRRRGQGAFRDRLREHYDETCAITDCKAIEALEAAHIIPHSELINKDYSCDNGLLLRADIHTLYDLNLIGVDQDGFVHVSPKLDYNFYRSLSGRQVKGTGSKAFSDNLGKRFEIYELINNAK